MAKIDIGEVVQLKSGGPMMTVTGKDFDKYVCVWHDFHRGFLERTFHAATVKIITDEELNPPKDARPGRVG